jgi:hypothetical protein
MRRLVKEWVLVLAWHGLELFSATVSSHILFDLTTNVLTTTLKTSFGVWIFIVSSPRSSSDLRRTKDTPSRYTLSRSARSDGPSLVHCPGACTELMNVALPSWVGFTAFLCLRRMGGERMENRRATWIVRYGWCTYFQSEKWTLRRKH